MSYHLKVRAMVKEQNMGDDYVQLGVQFCYIRFNCLFLQPKKCTEPFHDSTCCIIPTTDITNLQIHPNFHSTQDRHDFSRACFVFLSVQVETLYPVQLNMMKWLHYHMSLLKHLITRMLTSPALLILNPTRISQTEETNLMMIMKS